MSDKATLLNKEDVKPEEEIIEIPEEKPEDPGAEKSPENPENPEPETEPFPALFKFLPRFSAIGVENCKISSEPTIVNIFDDFKDQWVMIISIPGVDGPYHRLSFKRVMKRAQDFKERNCKVFLFTTDTYSSVRESRTKVEEHLNSESITFLVDREDLSISKKLGIYCEGKGDNAKPFCYPGYLIFTPDKELVQRIVIRDTNQLYINDAMTLFTYPIIPDAVGNMLTNLDELMPIYDIVLELRKTYPNANFGGVVDNIAENIKNEKKQEEKDGKSESIFNWQSWANAFTKAMGEGLQ